MSIVAQKITYIHPDNQVLFKGIELNDQQGAKGSLSREQRIGKIYFPPYLGWNLASAGREIIYPTPPYYVPQHFGQYDNQTVAQALRIDGKLEALRAITEATPPSLISIRWRMTGRSRNGASPPCTLGVWSISSFPNRCAH